MKLAPRRIFFATLILYAVLWFVPDKKIGLLVISAYVSYLWRYTTAAEALTVAFFAVTPLAVGKQFLIELVSATQLNISGRPFGISVDLVLTARDGIAALMGLLLARDAVRNRTVFVPRRPLGRLLLLLPFALTIAAAAGSILPGISLLHTAFFWEPYILYAFLATAKEPVRREAVLGGAVAALLFEGTLSLLQSMVGGPIGLAIEYFPEYAPQDLSRDVGGAVARMGGTFAHANLLASYLVLMLPMLLPVAFDKKSALAQEGFASVLLGSLSLLATLSRAAWIAVAMAYLLFFYLTEKRARMRLFIPRISRWSKLAVIGLAVFGAVLVLPRLASTMYTFERYGSVETRLLLLTEATKAVMTHPLFGVGLSMDVYYMFQRAKATSYGESVYTYFPEPVHNGFVKLMVETGLAGLVPYLLVLWVVAASVRARFGHSRGREHLYQIGFLTACVATLINIQFQPMIPDLQQFVPLTIIYGYFADNGQEV